MTRVACLVLFCIVFSLGLGLSGCSSPRGQGLEVEPEQLVFPDDPLTQSQVLQIGVREFPAFSSPIYLDQSEPHALQSLWHEPLLGLDSEGRVVPGLVQVEQLSARSLDLAPVEGINYGGRPVDAKLIHDHLRNLFALSLSDFPELHPALRTLKRIRPLSPAEKIAFASQGSAPFSWLTAQITRWSAPSTASEPVRDNDPSESLTEPEETFLEAPPVPAIRVVEIDGSSRVRIDFADDPDGFPALLAHPAFSLDLDNAFSLQPGQAAAPPVRPLAVSESGYSGRFQIVSVTDDHIELAPNLEIFGDTGLPGLRFVKADEKSLTTSLEDGDLSAVLGLYYLPRHLALPVKNQPVHGSVSALVRCSGQDLSDLDAVLSREAILTNLSSLGGREGVHYGVASPIRSTRPQQGLLVSLPTQSGVPQADAARRLAGLRISVVVGIDEPERSLGLATAMTLQDAGADVFVAEDAQQAGRCALEVIHQPGISIENGHLVLDLVSAAQAFEATGLVPLFHATIPLITSPRLAGTLGLNAYGTPTFATRSESPLTLAAQ